MTQSDELTRVKARIKALTEKTVSNGCTEAEAMSAAEMVGRLLDRYALSMDEIEVRNSRCVKVQVDLKTRRRGPIDGCVPALARFCDCKFWWTAAARSNDRNDQSIPGVRYTFFGFETDASLAGYLLSVINRAILNEALKFKAIPSRLKGPKLRKASTSFQHGVAARVAVRLESMKDEREVAVRAMRGIGTALVVVKQNVIDEAFREENVNLTGSQPLITKIDKNAFKAGWIAGERVNLNRPLHGDARELLT